jgi:hypothetical protein
VPLRPGRGNRPRRFLIAKVCVCKFGHRPACAFLARANNVLELEKRMPSHLQRRLRGGGKRALQWGAVTFTVAIAAALAVCPALALSVVQHSARPRAVTASTISVQETAQLRLVSRHGTEVLNESGKGSGTFRCPITARLTTAYTRAAIAFTITCSSKNTLSGGGEASFYVSGSTAHFSGNVAVTRGTGVYAHDSASTLKLSGTYQRNTYALAMSVSGRMRT